ncbi:hypothetical protein GYMLUDRAFT_250613 [Collybiopsis luxurians FD-317 M1]|uniref:Uncharacterized protein n=1 Tax=Collybiopsis luxurians FD-317 M1 TaxID=944289 RepID=A0A0D0AS04_9AGAR|nr:hypothetical protein GYMLUDRAFT_250613 [Collybiopsis luxurians FD-317 M1]
MAGLVSMAFLTVLPEKHAQLPIESDIPSEPGSFVPKLSYATYQDQSLSVLIRTLHTRIVDHFSAYASSTLPELTTAAFKPSNIIARAPALAARARLLMALLAEAPFTGAQLGPTFVKCLEKKANLEEPVTETSAMHPGFAKFKDIVAKLKLNTDSAKDSFNTIGPANAG